MRCRFCDTEIADKALICYRCGKPTTDAKVAAPPTPRGLSGLAAGLVAAAAAAVAAGLPAVADGALLWTGEGLSAVVALTAAVLWWGGRAGRR